MSKSHPLHVSSSAARSSSRPSDKTTTTTLVMYYSGSIGSYGPSLWERNGRVHPLGLPCSLTCILGRPRGRTGVPVKTPTPPGSCPPCSTLNLQVMLSMPRVLQYFFVFNLCHLLFSHVYGIFGLSASPSLPFVLLLSFFVIYFYLFIMVHVFLCDMLYLCEFDGQKQYSQEK